MADTLSKARALLAAAEKATPGPCRQCGAPCSVHENDWCDPPMWSVYCTGLCQREYPTAREAIDAHNSNPAIAQALIEAEKIIRGICGPLYIRLESGRVARHTRRETEAAARAWLDKHGKTEE